MTTNFPLTKPVKAHGEEVTSLDLRDPEPRDAREIKAMPYWVAPDQSVQLNPTAAAQYVVRCAGIPMSSVDQLDMGDFNRLCWVIAGFFLKADSPTTSS
ncbi:phage tail assembly protein [Cupriavidus oxalaticus]|uniref:Phage tail assembly protein n=1 Tax=Cupriavidus oxalaticus TaxID=96344 RepID=A0A4P7LR73_9BURK|nr:phage tail assembly protein [Cupriavidus oxalaticus]QBY56153.1 phage tail assembly protein [Cupriavidus oxalaticus]